MSIHSRLFMGYDNSAGGGIPFSSVSLLLHLNGSDGSTTFTDSSSYAHTVTGNGNAQIDTAQSVFGGASALFDGATDWLSIPSHAAFDFGSGDFTIELRVRLSTTTGNHHICGKYGGALTGPFALYQAGAQIGFYSSSNGTTWNLISNLTFGGSFATGTWYALAVTRSGDTWRTFLDGTLVSSSTTSGTVVSNSGAVTFGSNNSGSESWNGHMDEIRITKGAAHYTGTYVVDVSQFPDS